ncbi:MAG TPA: dienelactone hydrolase family protein [Gammaproteobacteria bacterium]|nr:dienelactone hydrolase family protein [Gammaproteobacteria bacterium]
MIAGVGCSCQRSAPPAPAPAPAVAAAPAPAAAPTPANAKPSKPLLEQDLAYGETKSRNLTGFLAMPADAAEPLPALIVIHDRWGLNDDVKTLTRRLASEGYIALAVDLYGGVTAATPAEAEKLMTDLYGDPESARSNLRQAYEYLEKYAFAPRIGSIGWSFGGGWSLEMAFLLPDQLDAMVSYYGPIVTDVAKLRPVAVPLLGLYGAADQTIRAQDVIAYRTLLTGQLQKNARVILYPNAKHAFASAGNPDYSAEASAQAWKETTAFLSENLKLKAASR